LASNEEVDGKSGGRLYLNRNLQIVFGVTLVAILGVSPLTPAFPKMVEALQIPAQSIGLLITAMSLPGAILAPFTGILADRFGRKKVLVPSLFLFGLAGGACALTRNFNTILLLRVLQGLGSAGLGSINITVIGDLFSGRQRAEAMGLNSAALNVGAAFYPSIGGAVAVFAWNYPFLLSLAAIPVGILVLTSLHSPEPRSDESFKDYLGGAWRHLKNLQVVGLFAVGVLTFVILFGAYLTYFALFLGQGFKASSSTIGLVMSSMSITTALVSSQMGRITRWFSEATLIKAAFLIYGLSLVLIPLMPNMWFLLVPTTIFGIAQGVNLPSIMTSVAGLAPLEYRAAFMSINGTMLRLGQAAGPPLLGLFYVRWGMEAPFFAAATIAVATSLIAIIAGRVYNKQEVKE